MHTGSSSPNLVGILIKHLTLSLTRPIHFPPTSDTIIRAIDFPSLLKKQGIFDQVKSNIAARIEQIAEAASKHEIPVARVDLAWNGPKVMRTR